MEALLLCASVAWSARIEATWAACKSALGGATLEVVRLPSGAILLVDEEGRLKGLPYNMSASIAAEQAIVGDAILVPRALVSRVLGGDGEEDPS